ncbi:calcium-binding protein [Donghicola sp.]|jgi:Ca2+-binding RTX toxin-like protein|uniref:calcium-binding protein n=1 Tax=Donghicola sp. TaxID=1929294 RepID=UPI0025DC437A|nr:calcium-binding protein [Donghicola sp.]MCT4577421.1 hypothetical protein [Donghicola sp.]
MAATFAHNNYHGAMQLLLLSVLESENNQILSSTSTRIDYGVNPLRDPYTNFFGSGMNGLGDGTVRHIDIYWPNVGSVAMIIDGLPDISFQSLLATADADDPMHALNTLLSTTDWTGTGGVYGESFLGFYGADSISGGDGNDVYTASMGYGQTRAISDHFDGGEDTDYVVLSELTTGVIANLGTGMVTFSEEVSGTEYARTLMLSNVEELAGTRFRDKITGSDDHDLFFGNAGRDVIRGGAGSDTISGDGGNDRLFGNDGNDWLSGKQRKDKLFGNDGDDELFGDAGNDKLKGDAGNDTLSGGTGRDKLFGGTGDDVLTGGRHQDTFIFAAGGQDQGNDLILDFQKRQDTIRFAGGDVEVTVTHENGDTYLDYDNGSIRLVGVTWLDEGVVDF